MSGVYQDILSYNIGASSVIRLHENLEFSLKPTIFGDISFEVVFLFLFFVIRKCVVSFPYKFIITNPNYFNYAKNNWWRQTIHYASLVMFIDKSNTAHNNVLQSDLLSFSDSFSSLFHQMIGHYLWIIGPQLPTNQNQSFLPVNKTLIALRLIRSVRLTSERSVNTRFFLDPLAYKLAVKTSLRSDSRSSRSFKNSFGSWR